MSKNVPIYPSEPPITVYPKPKRKVTPNFYLLQSSSQHQELGINYKIRVALNTCKHFLGQNNFIFKSNCSPTYGIVFSDQTSSSPNQISLTRFLT